MTTQGRKFDVNPAQVIAAREYIRRISDPELISERIYAVAGLPLDEVQQEWDNLPVNEVKIRAAQLLIRLVGGEENVDPAVVALAHTRLSETAAAGR